MATHAPAVLSRIVEARRAAVARFRNAGGLPRLEELARAAPSPKDFRAALKGPGVALIAECKQRSPSGGLLQQAYDPAGLARRYVANGAAALSVLTEPEFFGGAPQDLKAVRAAVEVPLLCKDFIVDESQLAGARAMGADAVLLIVAILHAAALEELHARAVARGLQPVVEVHTEEEVTRALAVGAGIIGINNRDLRQMRIDKGTTARLRPLIPRDRVVISESGIETRADVEAMARLGADAVLVGEALLRADDLEAKVRELSGR